MIKALAPVAALLISVSLLLTGQGLMGTLLPVRASLESFSTVAIAAFGAAYFLGFTIGCLKGGELVRRVGHVRVFLAMTAMASAAPLVHALAVNPATWGLLRLLTGFCFAVLYIVIESWLNESATNENRGIVFGTYAMITLSVLAAGQMMTLMYDPQGMQLFAVAAVLVSVAAIPVALSTSPSPGAPHSVAVDIRGLFRISPAGTAGCLVSGLANGAFWALAPVFTASISTDVALAAWFMTAAVLGGAVSQWPLGGLSDRVGRRRVLIAISAIAALVAAMTAGLASSASFVVINLLGAMWGALAFPLYTIAVAHANDYAEPNEYVTVSSGLLLMYGVGATIGPLVASTLITVGSGSMLFLYTCAAHVLLAVFALFRRFVRAGAPRDQHIAFGDALAATQTASPIYEEEIAQEDLEQK
jgi:MFS family permease